jgi:hypothetical protein
MNKSSHSLHPHRHISLSAPILTHKYTSISPNMHNTCTCTAVPHIASIQIAHHAFSYQNAYDAPATYATHRIQLSIMVLGTVILSYCHKLYAAYYHTTRIRKQHIATTPFTYTAEKHEHKHKAAVSSAHKTRQTQAHACSLTQIYTRADYCLI